MKQVHRLRPAFDIVPRNAFRMLYCRIEVAAGIGRISYHHATAGAIRIDTRSPPAPLSLIGMRDRSNAR